MDQFSEVFHLSFFGHLHQMLACMFTCCSICTCHESQELAITIKVERRVHGMVESSSQNNVYINSATQNNEYILHIPCDKLPLSIPSVSSFTSQMTSSRTKETVLYDSGSWRMATGCMPSSEETVSTSRRVNENATQWICFSMVVPFPDSFTLKDCSKHGTNCEHW